MDIKKLTNPVQNVKDKAQEVAGQVQEQFNSVLDEYQKVLPVASSLGLSVSSFEVHMGVLPEVRTSLVGLLDKINNEVVQKLIAEHQRNKLLVLILNSLLVTKELQQRLNISNLKGVVVDIKLGVPPNVSVRLAS